MSIECFSPITHSSARTAHSSLATHTCRQAKDEATQTRATHMVCSPHTSAAHAALPAGSKGKGAKTPKIHAHPSACSQAKQAAHGSGMTDGAGTAWRCAARSTSSLYMELGLLLRHARRPLERTQHAHIAAAATTARSILSEDQPKQTHKCSARVSSFTRMPPAPSMQHLLAPPIPWSLDPSSLHMRLVSFATRTFPEDSLSPASTYRTPTSMLAGLCKHPTPCVASRQFQGQERPWSCMLHACEHLCTTDKLRAHKEKRLSKQYAEPTQGGQTSR